jgi:protein-L-isoaspartate(D-aspartate) O-methyltransferase
LIDRDLFLSSDGITFDGKRAVPNEQVTRLMLELADLQPGEKVLEIGTGSGYQTACLLETEIALLDSIDCGIPSWKDGLEDSRLTFLNGNGTNLSGTQDYYDCIFVTCGMTSIPPAYEEQLREGGRLVIPLGKPGGQELLRLEKRNGKLVMGRCAGYVRFQMCS